MGYLDRDKILNSLTREHIISICSDLGSPDYKLDSKGNICFSTSICHGGDSPYKLVYYHESDNESKGRTFHCYTCGDTFSPIEMIIRGNRLKGKTVTYYKALAYLASVIGETSNFETNKRVESSVLADFEWINRIRNAQKGNKAIPTLREINENVLEIFSYTPHQIWLNDNISMEALSAYEIGYWGETDQITIPHRDKENRLIGVRGRFLDERDIELYKGKYMPLQIGGQFLAHSLGNNLYGINITQKRIKQTKKCIVYESEKSCLQNYSYFEDDSFAVAVCGSNISKTQIALMIKYLGVEEVLIAFDKEYDVAESWEAQAYYNKLISKVADMVPYVKVSLILDKHGLLDKKDSPSDKGKETLLKLLDEKIIITTNDLHKKYKGGNIHD